MLKFIPSSRYFVSTLLAAVLLSSCDRSNVERHPLNEKLGISGTMEVIVIDSCEYIYCQNGNATWASHKGNCKFCAARHSR